MERAAVAVHIAYAAPVTDDRKDEITLYLARIGEGDREAVDKLLPHIYADLRALAGSAFQGQKQDHTLQPTVLVHEVYLRLVGDVGREYEGRKHFFRVAAMAMRQLLTDHARARGREKRGGGRERVALDENLVGGSDEGGFDAADLDEALNELQELDERLARVVELRFLIGLTAVETAEVLGVSERTVRLDWNVARKLLKDRLTGGEA